MARSGAVRAGERPGRRGSNVTVATADPPRVSSGGVVRARTSTKVEVRSGRDPDRVRRQRWYREVGMMTTQPRQPELVMIVPERLSVHQ